MTQNTPEVSKAILDRMMNEGWAALQQFLAGLSDAQFNGPTDAAGWTVQDHVLHLADWEEGMVAMFDGQDRVLAMGIDPADWEADATDKINETLRQRHRVMDYSRAEVLERLESVHREMLERLERFSDADLQAPFPNPGGQHVQDRWIVWRITGNTFGHYEEHIPWMQAIVDGGQPQSG